MPVTKTWTLGVQLVNGWNNVVANNGGVTVGITSGYVKPKYTWNANYYFVFQHRHRAARLPGHAEGLPQLIDTPCC